MEDIPSRESQLCFSVLKELDLNLEQSLKVRFIRIIKFLFWVLVRFSLCALFLLYQICPTLFAKITHSGTLKSQDGAKQQKDSVFRSTCCRAGKVTGTLKLPRGGYVPGERIHAEVDVTNFTTRKIKETSLSLVQVKEEHFRWASIPAGSSRTFGEINPIYPKRNLLLGERALWKISVPEQLSFTKIRILKTISLISLFYLWSLCYYLYFLLLCR